MENKQQIHGPPRATLVPVTQPTVVYKTVSFYFADADVWAINNSYKAF